MTKSTKLVIVVTCIALVVLILALCLSPKSRIKYVAYDDGGKYYSLSTSSNNISSAELVDLIYWAYDELFDDKPKVVKWESTMGYPGISIIWQHPNNYIVITAFYANDNDSITVKNEYGTHKMESTRKNITECNISEIEKVFNVKRKP